MGDPTIGWIAAIVIGGIAGWLAEQFMKSDMGLLMNIVLGIVGAAIASAIFSFFGIAFGGWVGYLIAGFIGVFADLDRPRAKEPHRLSYALPRGIHHRESLMSALGQKPTSPNVFCLQKIRARQAEAMYDAS